MINTHEFYRDTNVIRRILEYCGVPASETANFHLDRDVGRLHDSSNLRRMTDKMTVEYVCGWGETFAKTIGKKASSRYNKDLGELLDGDLNLFRSVWDKQKMTFLLDVEYVSHKFPGEAYLNQEATFWKLEPMYRCIWDTLGEFGIKPLTLVTGQGYHFVFDVNSYDRSHYLRDRKVSPVARKLAEIGYLEETLGGKYESLPGNTKRRRIVEPELGKAFDAVGKLLEFIIHKVVTRLPKYNVSLPVGIGDLTPGNASQEIINLDLSSYADPLFTRVMRTAFSIHDKHKDKGIDIPTQITIPRYTPCNGNELWLDEVFRNRRHFHNSANYAAAITMNIPDCTEGVFRLIDDYSKSDLHKFHQEFDHTKQDHPNDWNRTYDHFDLGQLPPCVAQAVASPNPAMLQPDQIQALVRVLTGKRWWHPSHVAGLIRSKYERNHGWEFNWGKYDANRHAKV